MVVGEGRSITLNAKAGGGHAFREVKLVRFKDCLYFVVQIFVRLCLLWFLVAHLLCLKCFLKAREKCPSLESTSNFHNRSLHS